MFCVSCPNKGPLTRNFVICTNCSRSFHKSCAKRSGITLTGVIRKCCKDKFLLDSEIKNIPVLKSSSANTEPILPVPSRDSDSFIMAPSSSIKNLDELWEKINLKIDEGIGADLKTIEKNLSDLSESIDVRFKEVEERLDNLELNQESTKENITETILMEINNRKTREKNVIFCNVLESTSSDDDLIFINNPS